MKSINVKECVWFFAQISYIGYIFAMMFILVSKFIR